MPTIVISNNYKGAVLDIVRSCVPDGFTIKLLEENTEDNLVREISSADYLIASGRIPVSDRVLSAANKLRMIQRTGVGLDSIDMDAVRKKGVPLYVNAGVNSESVAEHSVLLILACLRRLTELDRNSKNNIWKKQEQGIRTYELQGKTVGIIGLGNIGKRVAELLKAFGAHLCYYDSFRASSETEETYGLEYKDINDLIGSADIITLHCPLLDTTKNMINRDSLNRMKDGVIIVNTSRGGLINEDDLYDALEDGKVAFAGLDVHAKEPFADNDRLIMHERVIATPHVAGVSYDSFRKMFSEAMRNIDLFDKGKMDSIADKLVG